MERGRPDIFFAVVDNFFFYTKKIIIGVITDFTTLVTVYGCVIT